MRVFIGLTEISGYYRGLQEGFQELGVESTFVNLSRHPFTYGGEASNPLIRLVRALGEKRAAARSPMAAQGWLRLHQVALLFLLAWAIRKHDAFIFGFNSTFFGFRELPLLKWCGKRILFQFHGSDSRPPYLDGSATLGDDPETIRRCIAQTRLRKSILQKIERYADVTVNIPPQAHFQEKPYVLWLKLGLTCRPPEIAHAAVPRRSDGEIRILHCPSHPIAKGTPRIEAAIQRLVDQGHRIHFVQVSGQPNAVVLEELERCDFVIDQLYADYGMPGFATEAAWYGRPTVIAGYATAEWNEWLRADERPPTLYVHPDDLQSAIEKLVVDRAYREQLGQEARRFVETHWAPERVAAGYVRLLQGDIPADWLVDPKANRYVHGVCFSEERAQAIVRGVLAQGGLEALQLRDKPELERLLVAFSQGSNEEQEASVPGQQRVNKGDNVEWPRHTS